ncbi:diguanylate cyclase domain-containing protein [Sporosarcina sp. FSL K6-3457]|uniref:diguanylate cyclase domain-containing protein n=1 Tax=Sporosarcina sp. FSL K6-3457 TaxID=2978204 RepID=UPI0030F708B1
MVNYFFNKTEENIGQNPIAIDLELIKYALNQSVMLAVMDNEGKIIHINDNYRDTLKYSLADLYMQDFQVLNSGYHSEGFYHDIQRILSAGEKWTGEICQRAKNGELHWLKTVIIPLGDAGNQPAQSMIVSVDITDQKNNGRWQYLACHNELTGLPNRRMLDLSIGTYIGRVKKKRTKLAVLFLDINQFKTINDTYGHAVGDLFLKEVANRLADLPILKNRVFHLSGDEFVMILEDMENLEEQVHLIMSLFDRLFDLQSYQIDASASIGISIYPDQATNREMLINQADLAMFEAKQYGGNSYEVYQ